MTDKPHEQVRAVLQELEGSDVIVSYVLIAKLALLEDAESTGYRTYYEGTLDERIGLLRYATIRAERLVASIEEEHE